MSILVQKILSWYKFTYDIGKVRSDNAIQQIQPFLHRLSLDGCGSQFFHFFFRQVIDHIGIADLYFHVNLPLSFTPYASTIELEQAGIPW